jgi:hypothetical protein
MAQLAVPDNDPVMLGAFKLPVIVNPDPDIVNEPVIDWVDVPLPVVINPVVSANPVVIVILPLTSGVWLLTVLTDAVNADPVIDIPNPVKAIKEAVTALEALVANDALVANEALVATDALVANEELRAYELLSVYEALIAADALVANEELIAREALKAYELLNA